MINTNKVLITNGFAYFVKYLPSKNEWKVASTNHKQDLLARMIVTKYMRKNRFHKVKNWKKLPKIEINCCKPNNWLFASKMYLSNILQHKTQHMEMKAGSQKKLGIINVKSRNKSFLWIKLNTVVGTTLIGLDGYAMTRHQVGLSECCKEIVIIVNEYGK